MIASHFYDSEEKFALESQKRGFYGQKGRYAKRQNREKTKILHKFTFQAHETTFSCLCEPPCALVCHFKQKVEVVTNKEKFEPCWGNVKEVNHLKLPK